MPFRIRPIFEFRGTPSPTKGKPEASGSRTRLEAFA